MNTDRLISDWLRSAAPPRAPRTLLDATLERVATLPQDHPWTAGVRVVGGRRADPRLLLVAAVVGGTALIGSVLLAGGVPGPHPSPAARGSDWIAVVTPKTDGSPGSNISLVRPGMPFRVIAGGEEVDRVHRGCPSFSGDGTQLAYGQASLAGGNPQNAALVIQRVAADGTVTAPWAYPVTAGVGGAARFAPPCAVWAPGRPLFAFVNATADPTDPVGFTGTVITVRTLSGGRNSIDLDAKVIDLSWSPGGDLLAVSTTNGIELVPIQDRGPQLLAGTKGAGRLDWSPDGERIAYERPSASGGDAVVDLVVRTLGTNQESVVAAGYAVSHGIGPLWSQAGDALLYQRVCRGCREQHDVVALTLRPGQSNWTADAVSERVLATPLINGFRWYPEWSTWSPDGSAVLEFAWPQGDVGPSPNVLGLIVVPRVGDSEPELLAEYQPDTGAAEALPVTGLQVGVSAGVPGVSQTTWAQVP
jgi:Tol biopolymer transport system component